MLQKRLKPGSITILTGRVVAAIQTARLLSAYSFLSIETPILGNKLNEGFAFASKTYLATSLRTALLERLIQSVHNRQRGGDWIIEQLWRELFQDGWEVVSPVEQTLLNLSSTVKLW